MKLIQEYKFFNDGQCVDADECLYSHNKDKSNKEQTQRKKRSIVDTDFCKDGLNCAQVDCEYGDDKHRRIRDVPCRFQENCTKQECPFKHIKNLDFHKGRNNKRKL